MQESRLTVKAGACREELLPRLRGGAFHVTCGAVFDIVLRMIRADPRPTPWMVIVDSNLFLGLDNDNKCRLVEALAQLDEPAVQTMVCVNSETDAIKLKAADTERWLGSTNAGALTVHSFL